MINPKLMIMPNRTSVLVGNPVKEDCLLKNNDVSSGLRDYDIGCAYNLIVTGMDK